MISIMVRVRLLKKAMEDCIEINCDWWQTQTCAAAGGELR